MSENFIVSASPHIRDKNTVPGIMWRVNLALLPAALAGIYYFGWYALAVVLVSLAAALATEAVINKLTGKKNSLSDGSAFTTGLLLAMIIPPGVPLWMPAVGSVFAIAIVKHAFGGLGCNIFNPALAGRAFLLASWTLHMTTWKTFIAIDGITGATPLAVVREQGMDKLLTAFGGRAALYQSLFWGQVGGSLGETSALALLAGGIYLLWKRIITWHIPVSFMATVALFAWVFGGEGLFQGDPLFHLLAGGLILGAFFMATDYVTSPLAGRGKLIFGIGAGIITILIRLRGGYPEGVCYSILLMNATTPLIDRYIRPRKFGG